MATDVREELLQVTVPSLGTVFRIQPDNGVPDVTYQSRRSLQLHVGRRRPRPGTVPPLPDRFVTFRAPDLLTGFRVEGDTVHQRGLFPALLGVVIFARHPHVQQHLAFVHHGRAGYAVPHSQASQSFDQVTLPEQLAGLTVARGQLAERTAGEDPAVRHGRCGQRASLVAVDVQLRAPSFLARSGIQAEKIVPPRRLQLRELLAQGLALPAAQPRRALGVYQPIDDGHTRCAGIDLSFPHRRW